MQLIFGFSGGMGSGKSTAIEVFKSQSSDAVFLLKFAAPLYAIQEFIYKIVSPVYQRPPEFVKDRKLLQWLGTDWGRDTISENVWVDLWKSTAAKLRSRDPELVIVCDDVRFDNEAQAIQAMGGYIVRIDSANSAARITTANGHAAHQSEAGISDECIDYRIQNNGTLEEFKESLTKLFAQIKAEQAA